MSAFDLDRFVRVIAMVGSAHDGEAPAAARLAERLLRDGGLTWADLLKPHAELSVGVEAARQLLAENEQFRAELDEYRNSVPIAHDWRQVGDHRAQARWAIDLADRGLVRLNDFERKFLTTVSRWRGALTDGQQPIWQDLLPEIARRSGRIPP
jgi:hypothetical protein